VKINTILGILPSEVLHLYIFCALAKLSNSHKKYQHGHKRGAMVMRCRDMSRKTMEGGDAEVNVVRADEDIDKRWQCNQGKWDMNRRVDAEINVVKP
jgi:hypothetical protein